jgi:maltose O-acetyltransferase
MSNKGIDMTEWDTTLVRIRLDAQQEVGIRGLDYPIWNKEPVSLRNVLRRFVTTIFNAIQSSGFIIIPVRTFLLRRAGMKMGHDCCIFENSNFGHPNKITLGNGVFINSRCLLDDNDYITIESNVSIAPGVKIITGTHLIGKETNRAGKHTHAPVKIGLGSWIGVNATILPGVTIASGCIIAAGSVVTNDTIPNGMYAGVPAKRFKNLSDEGETE